MTGREAKAESFDPGNYNFTNSLARFYTEGLALPITQDSVTGLEILLK